jgi:glycosyltransferase involved in cell wall biosynthesis
MISIVTPLYNRADVIFETAASILKQTNNNWEWIVVDDGSTDNSWQIIQDLASKDTRIKLFKRNRLPKGAPTCRNIGVENCSGDYILFLDSDDLLASFCIEQRLKATQDNPDEDLLIFPMLLFKKKPNDTGIFWNIDKSIDDITRIMIGDAICQTTGPLWKKKAFDAVGGWDEELQLWQDVDLHLRAFLKEISCKKLMNLSPDTFIRLSDMSVSRTGFNSIPKFRSRIKVFKSSLKLAEDMKLFYSYRKGFMQMGHDLICSSIFNNHFKEASELINIAEQYQLFSGVEKLTLKRYFWAKKLKLYRLPLFKIFSVRPTLHYFADYTITLGNVKYNEIIKF